ncbi:tetraacyldisaccharide 4'-kinase [bacterium J17]|nr:tetraacyldisaccharide 4'-kinase [bacterium J17]
MSELGKTELDITAQQIFSPILIPASFVYRLIADVRNKLFDLGVLKSLSVSLPVICVGNVSVGGNGKTPFTRFLATNLQDKGARPAILLRGYGGSSVSPRLVKDSDRSSLVGDEALMYVNSLADTPVVVAKDRVAGAKFIEEQAIADLIVLDDGLQHRRLKRDFNFVLVDVSDQKARADWANPRCLPAGRMREAVDSALRRADAVVFTNRSAGRIAGKSEDSSAFTEPKNLRRLPPGLPAFDFVLNPGKLLKLDGGSSIPLSEFQGQDVIALTAIAKPGVFFRMLDDLGLRLRQRVGRRDHHQFTVDEIEALGVQSEGCPIIVTEKDAVKLSQLPIEKDNIFVLELSADLKSEEQKSQLFSLLDSLVSARTSHPSRSLPLRKTSIDH